jgi:acetyltransferase EpsM
MRDLVVIGGGEHARVVMDAALSRPGVFRLLGFADVDPCEETVRRFGVANLGDDAACIARMRGTDAAFVNAVGTDGVSGARERVTQLYERAGVSFGAVVHASAWVSPSAIVEHGAVVLGGAQVNTGAVVGAHAIVNTGAIVEHDVRIGRLVSVAPGVVIGGGASVGEGSYLGLGCRIRDHRHVGTRVRVGMGAVVVSSIEDGLVVAGVPARPFRSR